MPETTTDIVDKRGLVRILPMYIAAYAVILCGLASYVSTYEDETFGARGYYIVLLGLGVSLVCRWRKVRQNTVFGVLAGLVMAVLVWGSVNGMMDIGSYFMAMAGDRSGGPAFVLAWFLLLCSFAMISDEVIIFSVVPSIALLGTMASDNLNAEIVVYFLGLVMGAVFLLVYENILSRGGLEGPPAPQASRATTSRTETSRPVPGRRVDGEGTVEPAVRVSLLLTSVVAALALVVGFAASLPLSYIGRTISERTPDINLPAAAEFAANVSNRYINQLELDGAPPHLSDRVVLQVRAPRPFYWRGKVFNHYTGYSWTSESVARPLDPTGPVRVNERNGSGERNPYGGRSEFSRWQEHLFILPKLEDGQETRAREPVQQMVQMLDPPLAGMLISASEPDRIRIRRSRLSMDPERGLSIWRGRRGGMEYQILSQVSVATPEQLRKAGTAYPVALKSKFTRLEDNPEDAPRERGALARRITDPHSNPYDKVKALETYLRDNFEYSLTPPRTPRSEDAVNYFLTESRQGYCEIFASTMAVLAREVGIPARLATGFAPGEWQPDGERGWGRAIVREKDMHAWTEVYFPGYGWIEFDPTSSRQANTSWVSSFKSFMQSMLSQLTRYRTGPLLVMMSMAAIALFLLKTYGLDPLRASLWWRAMWARHRRDLSADQRWDLLYARSHRRLKRWSGLKAAHQTPFEYAAEVRPSLPLEAAEAFDALTHLYVRHSFQRGAPQDADVIALLELDDTLKRALRRKPAMEPAPAAA